MASHGSHGPPYQAPRHAPYGGQHRAPPSAPQNIAPAGTFAPGTKIQVGSHRVVIQKYLSEGGFAHVYLVKLPKPVDGTDLAVLKRVAVPDKESLRGMRTEVETMKRLKGHRPIVTYIDSHASEMKHGGYEVFLLMENCDGGGLIDFMNTRLQHRLTEPEILSIFSDVAEGLACMHYLKPPLLHRDIKVENVLIVSRGSSKRFKLCDFGSAAVPRPAPTTIAECRAMDEDIQKHTTLQYRSPEMVDVYQKKPMDEKCDIWALGVFLYKLCYYTTPFENQGQLAILNASYDFPPHPAFSHRLKALIKWTLQGEMQNRPNIYQVLKEVCAMQNRAVPIQNIYSNRPASASPAGDRPLPERPESEGRPAVGAVYAPPSEAKASIPDVVPMRRGRPTAAAAAQAAASAKITKGDPFAALDARSIRRGDPDDIASRFPSLDQFSLLHDSGSKFEFEDSPITSPPGATSTNQKLAEHLADQAFAASSPESSHRNTPGAESRAARPPVDKPSAQVSSPPTSARLPSAPSGSASDVSRAQSIISQNPDLKAISSQSASRYVSTGTMTSPDTNTNSTKAAAYQAAQGNGRLPVSQMQSPRVSGDRRSVDQASLPVRNVVPYSDRTAVSPPAPTQVGQPQGVGSPGNLVQNRQSRPASGSFESSNLDYLRENEMAKSQSRASPNPAWTAPKRSPSLRASADGADMTTFTQTSDLGYLKDLEAREAREESERLTGRLSADARPQEKPNLTGKFSNAFKRFETNSPSPAHSTGRSPSPQKGASRNSQILERPSSSVADNAEEEVISPEKKREMERQQLLDEEARVAQAKAEYRTRTASNTGDSAALPAPRAVRIQDRVNSLLNNEERVSPVHRQAEGYGKYSDAATAASKVEKPGPSVPRKPTAMSTTARVDSAPAAAGTEQFRKPSLPSPSPGVAKSSTGRPVAPKKPMHLNSLPTGSRANSPVKPSRSGLSKAPATHEEELIAFDLPDQPALDMSAAERDSYLENFSKRYPSLSSMEMTGGDGGK